MLIIAFNKQFSAKKLFLKNLVLDRKPGKLRNGYLFYILRRQRNWKRKALKLLISYERIIDSTVCHLNNKI